MAPLGIGNLPGLGSNSSSGSSSGDDFFTQLSTNPSSLTGPDYKYAQYINTPNQMGVGPGENDFVNDIAGVMSYVEILIQGTGKASQTGQPLGNRFFMKTAAQCTASDTKGQVDRYIYVNNIPTGNIPFITGATGKNMKDLRGLIPGVLTDLNAMNPIGILQAFTVTGASSCTPITMPTMDQNNISSTDTKYVLDTDIKAIDSCVFPNQVNPLTKVACQMGFTNMEDPNKNPQSYEIARLPRDPVVQCYFLGLGLLSIYFMYRIAGKAGVRIQ